MKRLTTLIILFLAFIAKGQTEMQAAVEAYGEIAHLIKCDSIEKLASLVVYPLKRGNPVPDINSATEFISYYDTLFDKEFRKRVVRFDSSDVSMAEGEYMLFNGDIWINLDGNIIAVYYVSEKEKQLSQKLTNEIRAKMYPAIIAWKRNIIVCKTEKFLIRIDDINGHDSLRYMAWGKGKQVSDKPDIVLYRGSHKFQGTQGGITYTFAKGEWKYVIDEVWMCADEKPDECGTFLRIIHNDKEVETLKCTEIK